MYIVDEPLYVHAYSIDSLCSRVMNSKDILNRKYSLQYVNDNIADKDFLRYFNPFFTKDFVVKFMFEYQYPVFYTKILNEEFDKNQRFILFGASNYGRQCLGALEKNGYMNIIFADNNIKKQNTFIRGHKIISIDQLREIKKDTDILIISSQYFVSILKQLIDNKIISDVSEVLISKNNTKVKNALKETFEYFLTLENN